MQAAQVAVVHASGRTRTVAATLDPATGRWRTSERLTPTERAYVPAGGLRDAFGETNGNPSATVVRAPGR